MEVKPGFKQTVIGILPKDWEISTALEVCELVVDCKNRTPPVVGGGDYAVVRTPNVRNGKFVRDELRFTDVHSFREWTARTVPQAGDIFITREAPLGEVCMAPSDLQCCLGQRMMLYRADINKIDNSFLLYALLSPPVQRNLQMKIGGSTVGHAKVNDIRNLQIPVPPNIAEQEAIAAALSDIDALVTAQDKLIGKKRDIKQAAMQELLTGKRRLPGFTGEWTMNYIGGIVDIKKGSLITEKDVKPGIIPVIAGGKKPAYFHDTPNRFGKTITISGSGANAGYIAFYPMPIFASDCSTISEGKRYSIEFIYFQLMLKQNVIYNSQTGGAQPHIHPSDLRPININMPPSHEEQNAIAGVLSDMDAVIAALEQKQEKTRALKQGMMQELLTGRVRLV